MVHRAVSRPTKTQRAAGHRTAERPTAGTTVCNGQSCPVVPRPRGGVGHGACYEGGMEPRLSLITLGVTDLARARAFYEALGFPPPQQPDDEVCFFQLGGTAFALWTQVGGHGAPGVELAHNPGWALRPDGTVRVAGDA
jgi:hypothetical protein